MRRKTNRKGKFSKTMISFRTARLLVGLSVLLCLASACLAQVDRAGLTGTITDSSGRAVPTAHVVAVHNATELKRESVSSGNVTYDIPEMPVGAYAVSFAHEGFKSLSFGNVVQVMEQTRTLNATLQVSGVEEQIEISASSEQLDENSSAYGTRIEHTQVKELSLNDRNYNFLSGRESDT